jgi:hypothetical protein
VPDVTGMDALTAALAYAARGWPVFPCKPGRKAPNTEHGFLNATVNPTEIRAWWRQHPCDNVAIATGSPAVDVLDVDVKPSGTGFAAFNRLKRAGLLTGACALVRTRSGGLHVYFAGSRQDCGRLVSHHLDFKAGGGYVVAPPSFVEADDTGPAGAYELLDHRAADGHLDWQAVRRLLDPPRDTMPRNGKGGDIGGLTEWVAVQPEGNRNAGLYWAARRAVEEGLDPTALVLAAVTAGLSETEAHRTIDSARRTRQ